MGVIWSQEVATIMSNIPEESKTEFSMLKLDIENMAKEMGVKKIDLGVFLKLKVDFNKIYTNPIRGEFTNHFKEAMKVEFNPQAEYPKMFNLP